MSDGFDPYHKWLGIPSREQPANYYRLLGLEPFEDDLDAIEGAADRLLKYVRDVATVEQRRHARRVVDELSAAKRCLLIAAHKQAYDAGLRAGGTGTPNKTPAQTTKPLTAVKAAPVVATNRTEVRRRLKPSRLPLPLMAAGLAIVLIAAGGLGVLMFRGDSDSEKRVANTSEVRRPIEVTQSTTEDEAFSPDTRSSDVETIIPKPAEPEPLLPEFEDKESDSDQSSVKAGRAVEPSAKEPILELSDEPIPVGTPESGEEPKVLKSRGELSATREEVQAVGRGGLLREVWNEVVGNKVEEFILYVAEHPEPDQTETIDRFETSEDFGDQYGQRLRGYLHPPTSGSYEFSIRANAEGWLYVSTDATPENKRRVEPKTAIELLADQAYYFEAFHKESTGRDYLSIGWKLPDGTEEKPIPGACCSVQHRIAPRHESEFVVLTPMSAKASSGTKLALVEGGQIVASGSPRSDDTYRLTFETEIETITALQVEAIPNESFPASGPGRGVGGRFTLGEITAFTANRDAPEVVEPVKFASAADGEGNDVRRIIDGDEKTLWRVSGRGKASAAILIVEDPVSRDSGATVHLELNQREGLGRFRVLATSAPDPSLAARSEELAGIEQSLYSLSVNLGGGEFTAPDGTRWLASKFYDNDTFGHEGGRSVTEDLIANKVQGSALRGVTAFRAVVPDGTYDVTLYFCEYWSTTPTSRQFAIAVEQRVVAANFDLLRVSGGFAKPMVYPIRGVAVKDGRLDLQFQATSKGASTILNAIRIKQVR